VSISGLVPGGNREAALLEEIEKESGRAETGVLVDRAIGRFLDKLTPLELARTTPSGTLWWPGRFRFDLDALKKKGKVRRPEKGCWELT